MREDFEDAFYLACDAWETVTDALRVVIRYFIFATIPVWILPYAIVKAVKEDKDNG